MHGLGGYVGQGLLSGAVSGLLGHALDDCGEVVGQSLGGAVVGSSPSDWAFCRRASNLSRLVLRRYFSTSASCGVTLVAALIIRQPAGWIGRSRSRRPR